MVHHQHTQPMELKTLVRNRYFYGKLLDVFHFDLEQSYFNAKRWLLNRRVFGYGVICGLDVRLSEDRQGVIILPGIALDKWGREIIVPQPSAPVPLASTASQATYTGEQRYHEEADFVHVVLCFHECESDPVPALAGNCDTDALCASSIIREQYSIAIKDGKAPEIMTECSIPDVISGGRINYPALAIQVTRACPALPDDPCIPLANVRLPKEGMVCHPDDIDITVRPIVYTNDLLFELILALMNEEQNYPSGGKR
jgi:hypothetical protein